jgi:hypothetical protein
MAFSRDRRLVATGEVGPKPWLHIWEAETLQPVFSSKFILEKGINCCAFSPDCSKVACAAINDDHNVAVVSVKDGLIASSKSGREAILGVVWTTESEFATVGIKHFCHWKLEGKNLVKTKAKINRNNCLLVSVAADG